MRHNTRNVILIAAALLAGGWLMGPSIAQYTPVRSAGTLVWDATKFVFSVSGTPIATLTSGSDLTIGGDFTATNASARVDDIGVGKAASGEPGIADVLTAVRVPQIQDANGVPLITLTGGKVGITDLSIDSMSVGTDETASDGVTIVSQPALDSRASKNRSTQRPWPQQCSYVVGQAPNFSPSSPIMPTRLPSSVAWSRRYSMTPSSGPNGMRYRRPCSVPNTVRMRPWSSVV